MSRYGAEIVSDEQAMSKPRAIGAAVCALVALVAILVLWSPVDVGDVRCGTGLSGVTEAAERRDADGCADAMATRRWWGWPFAGVGVVAMFAILTIGGWRSSGIPEDHSGWGLSRS